MRTIEELCADVHVLAGLPDDQRSVVAGCAQLATVTDGRYLFREGDPATKFYAVRRGAVALEIAPPSRAPLVIETVHEGDVVGWSWLFEPYTTRFDARVIGDTHLLVFDGTCLRGKCEDDHDLGYELMRRFAGLITERLQATRMRVLDLYGAPAGAL